MSDEKAKAAKIDALKKRWLECDEKQKALAVTIQERTAAKDKLAEDHKEAVARLERQIVDLRSEHKAKLVAADSAIELAKESRAGQKEVAGGLSFSIQSLGETWPPRE